MVPLVNIIFLIIALALLIIIGVYDIKAAQGIATLSSQDSAIASAHKYATGAAVFAILGAAIIIGLIVAYFIFGSETISRSLNNTATIMLIITLIFILISGILSAIVAAKLNTTTNGNATIRKAAYSDAIIATLIGIFGFVLLAGILIFIRIREHRSKQEKLANMGAELQKLAGIETQQGSALTQEEWIQKAQSMGISKEAIMEFLGGTAKIK